MLKKLQNLLFEEEDDDLEEDEEEESFDLDDLEFPGDEEGEE